VTALASSPGSSEPGRPLGDAVCSVNGKAHVLERGETISRLLERLGYAGPYALVERNGEPVERARFAEVELGAGDRLVVARPVAGG
jgi:thiamine biosynthesis protein ThiS